MPESRYYSAALASRKDAAMEGGMPSAAFQSQAAWMCANRESAVGWGSAAGDEDLVRNASSRAPALYRIVLGSGEFKRPAGNRQEHRRAERLLQADHPVRQLHRLGGGRPGSNELGSSDVLRREP